MQRWKPSGARLNARPWKEANNGPRIGFDGNYSNSSKRLITGAGSTALWGINHLWTSNKTTTKNGKDRVKYCDHKKGGREPVSPGNGDRVNGGHTLVPVHGRNSLRDRGGRGDGPVLGQKALP